MIIKNSQQDIHIVEDESTTTLGHRLSGGADSAIVGYMLSKFVVEERPDIKIMPITITLAGKQYQLIYAKRILEFLKNEFGDIFVEHQTSHASQLNKYVSSLNTLVDETRANTQAKIIYSGITSNPPKKIYKQWLPHTGPSDNRNGKRFCTKNRLARNPLVNIDKKGIAELYNTLGVMDTLFPITRSCEAWEKDEKNYNIEKHCEKCWWCRERYWGFGRYK